jgi:cyclic pyranopterin phosphate synthase
MKPDPVIPSLPRLGKNPTSRPRRLEDMHGRQIHYLRVSLTDACNLRCVYCMPEEMTFRPKSELMTTGELVRLLDRCHALGFDKFRFTGGEPTLRSDLVDLVAHAASLPGRPFTAITTNGILLPKLAGPLREAGLRRVNVSLDTLDPERFRRMARRGNLEKVLDGLRAADAAGLEVKLNAVVVRNFNEEDVVDLAALSLEHSWQIRFLEMMPFGNNDAFQTGQRVEEGDTFARIQRALGRLEPVSEHRDGEAKVFRLSEASGTLGFISPVTDPFCADCNRARLTADGKLRLCLLKDDEVDLLTPMRAGAGDAALEQLVRDGIWHKPWGHDLAHDRFSTNRGMSQIGG